MMPVGNLAPQQHDVLASLLARLNDFVVVPYDSGGVIQSWHPEVGSQLGYGPQEFVGQPISSFISGDNAGDLDNTAEPRICRARKKDGGTMVMSAVTIPMRPLYGQSAGFITILRSVTSLSDTEDAARAVAEVLEHSNVLIRRLDGVIEHWSAGCERLYGFMADEAVGHSLFELLPTEYPVTMDELNTVLKQTRSWHGELKQVRKDGTAVYVSAQLVLLRRTRGLQPLVVATHSDISSQLKMREDLVSANARLKRMADELERSNEELEEFARIASHDLSAPLTTTRWLVDLLSSRHGQHLNDDGKKCLKQIALSLSRMAELVEAVLQHAQMGTSAIGAAEGADTELALEAALENLRRDVETSGASIQYQRLPPLLIGQQPLTQLFQNLLSNAIKYRQPGLVPVINISAEPSGALWRFALSDNGLGIPEEWRERIFLPMQRMHGSEIAGSGIGLATCRKIVNRAGGRIWVEPNAHSGSTFYFTLPSSPSTVLDHTVDKSK